MVQNKDKAALRACGAADYTGNIFVKGGFDRVDIVHISLFTLLFYQCYTLVATLFGLQPSAVSSTALI